MSKGPKKVLLTPKEQELRIVRKPKANKSVAPVPMTRTMPENAETIKVFSFSNPARVKFVLNDEEVPRQPFHNRKKNRKEKSTLRR